MSEYADEYQTSILTKDGLFTLKQYKDEKELEKLVVSNADKIFGANSVYFDVKQRVKSIAKTRITDGLLLDLENKMFWIVENELSKHDPYRDIELQINGFIRALGNEKTLAEIVEVVYTELKKEPKKLHLVRKILAEQDVHYAITKMLRDNCGILIVIDKITLEIAELKDDFASKKPTHVIEFKTYEKDSKMIFAFTPINKIKTKSKQKTKQTNTWAELLVLASQPVQNLANAVTTIIEHELDEVYHKPYWRWYFFYCRETLKRDSLFAVMMLRKNYLTIRFCLPSSFKDTHGLLKPYKGWFFMKKDQRELGLRIDARSTWSLQEQIYFKEYLKEAHNFAVERTKGQST